MESDEYGVRHRTSNIDLAVPARDVRVRIYTGDTVHGEREMTVTRGEERSVKFDLGAS